MAPELFGASEVKKNRKTDVYAFGITMLEVSVRRLYFFV
jgi:hypothetical protein